VTEEGFTLVGEQGAILGWAGRLRPELVDAPAWAGAVWGLELTLPADPAPAPVPVFQPLPPFPGVDRDLALLLPNSLKARQVEEVIRGAAGPLLRELKVFDLYAGQGVPTGYRSVAYRLRFQSGERTLTDKDVDKAVRSVTEGLLEELGVEQRG